jgi:hypothetical protein
MSDRKTISIYRELLRYIRAFYTNKGKKFYIQYCILDDKKVTPGLRFYIDYLYFLFMIVNYVREHGKNLLNYESFTFEEYVALITDLHAKLEIGDDVLKYYLDTITGTFINSSTYKLYREDRSIFIERKWESVETEIKTRELGFNYFTSYFLWPARATWHDYLTSYIGKVVTGMKRFDRKKITGSVYYSSLPVDLKDFIRFVTYYYKRKNRKSETIRVNLEIPMDLYLDIRREARALTIPAKTHLVNRVKELYKNR